MPDVKGRTEIINWYLRKIKVDPGRTSHDWRLLSLNNYLIHQQINRLIYNQISCLNSEGLQQYMTFILFQLSLAYTNLLYLSRRGG